MEPPSIDEQFVDAVVNEKLTQLKNLLHSETGSINVNQVLAAYGCTALHLSAMRLNPKMARLLLKHGAYMRKKSRDGNTCLHFAAATGHRELIELFLRGSRINAVNNRGLTPLHVAVQEDHLDVVLILLNNKARINTQNSKGNTPLHDAVRCVRNLQLIECLLSHGADPNLLNNERDSAFHRSFALQNDNVVELLLGHGADVELKDYDGENALHLAARYSGPGILQKLLERKMNCNEVNRDGATALHLLLLYNHNDEDTILAMARALVAFSASIDAADCEDQTPMYCAAIRSKLKIVEYLWSLGADINGSGGCLPIFPTVENGHLKMVNFLIGRGAKLDTKSDNDETTLHIAINCVVRPDTCFKVVKLLIENGVDIDERDRDGWTALQLALDRGDSQIVDYLLSRGASILTWNSSLQSPLYIAVYNGALDAARKLLSLGAEVNDHDCNRCSVLSIAVGNDDEEMVQLLLKSGATANDISAIFAAARNGCVNMLKILAWNGAVIEHGKTSGYLIFVEAIKYRKPTMVQYLLDDGADVNFGLGESVPLYHAVTDYHDENFVLVGSGNRKSKKTIEILMKHIALLLTLNRNVSEVNMEVIKWYQWTSECFDTYQQELIDMMHTKVNDLCYTSYFDVLSRRHNSLVHCLRCDEVVAVLKSGAHRKMFANYADVLEINFRRGMRRLEMVNEFQGVLSQVLGAVLPCEIIDNIVEYLNDKDLKICLRE